MKVSHDVDLMALADGESDENELEALLRDPVARRKFEAIGELGELVRGHLELSADAVPQKRLDAVWREIDKAIEREAAPAQAPENAPAPAAPESWLRRVGRWFDQYRGHVITGAVSAGAVAALALIVRGPEGDGRPTGSPGDLAGRRSGTLDVMPAVNRPAEIESLDTPGGTGTVFNLKDEDGGTTTVIWVTPEDTVEGI